MLPHQSKRVLREVLECITISVLKGADRSKEKNLLALEQLSGHLRGFLSGSSMYI